MSWGTKEPLSVVTDRLPEGKEHRATIISGLTCLWDSGATDIIIKKKHTKPDERKMSSNKVECSTAAGTYSKTHDIKVPFFMPDFSRSKIISHLFRVDKSESESGIGYDMTAINTN